jgi:hypothetical protein
MAWTIDLLNNLGTVVLANAPWSTAQVTWALDGPGALEVNLRENQAAQWIPGQRRVRVMRDGVAVWQGFLNRIRSEGPAGDIHVTASALGLASILEKRVVHGDFSRVNTVASTIAWDLITHAQLQTDGNYGFTLGSSIGTATSRTRHFCDGDVIRDAIDELAEHEPGGFDWEISATGAFNVWVSGRGVATGLTVAQSQSHEWSVEADYTDVPTYMTVMGSSDQPCGAPLVIRNSAFSSTWPRREDDIDADTTDSAEMTTRGDGELRKKTAARIHASTMYVTETRVPFAWDAIGLGDRVTMALGAWYGGTQTMRCTQVDVSLEIGSLRVYQYQFEGF